MQENPRPEREDVVEEPSEDEIRDALGDSSAWDCYYDPTMNDNWHDDVVCHNGFDSIRPVLLPNSSFVTRKEMESAGRAYEDELNSGR